MNDVVMALYSDRLFMAAVGVYVLAMVLHAAEYATSVSTRTPAAQAVAVGAGPGGALRADAAAGGAADDEPVNGDAGPARGRGRADRLGGAAVNLVVLGAVLQLGSIVARGLATDRWPLGNMYEFTSMFCLAAVVTWLVVLRTWSRRAAAAAGARQGGPAVAGPVAAPGLRVVGLFVLFPVVILLFLAGTVLYARAAPVVPALRSYWLVVHVTTITVSSGLLIVPGVASLLFLLRGAEGADRSPEHADPASGRSSSGCPAPPLWTASPTARRSSPSRSTRSA